MMMMMFVISVSGFDQSDLLGILTPFFLIDLLRELLVVRSLLDVVLLLCCW